MKAGSAGDLAGAKSSTLQARRNDDWTAEYRRLWKTLVPPRGPAQSLQGEMIRLTGRLSDEAFRNGNINWRKDHVQAWKFVGRILHDPSVFSSSELAEIDRNVRSILRNYTVVPVEIAGSPYDELAHRAVQWCLAHQKLLPLPKDQMRYDF